MTGDQRKQLYDRVYESVALLRHSEPKKFAKILRQVRRGWTIRAGRQAAEEHMARVAEQIDAAERRLAGREG